MITFWEIVFIRVGENIETTGYYDDIADARADYIQMTQEHPEDYEYVCLKQIQRDYYSLEEYVTYLHTWYAK